MYNFERFPIICISGLYCFRSSISCFQTAEKSVTNWLIFSVKSAQFDCFLEKLTNFSVKTSEKLMTQNLTQMMKRI